VEARSRVPRGNTSEGQTARRGAAAAVRETEARTVRISRMQKPLELRLAVRREDFGPNVAAQVKRHEGMWRGNV
jgi:hypothetical protein